MYFELLVHMYRVMSHCASVSSVVAFLIFVFSMWLKIEFDGESFYVLIFIAKDVSAR